MFVHMFSRFSVSLFMIALISGCASNSDGDKLTVGNECKWNPSSCMYEGSYEPGEREYAEQEAKDLNKAAAKKLRRRSGWWW